MKEKAIKTPEEVAEESAARDAEFIAKRTEVVRHLKKEFSKTLNEAKLRRGDLILISTEMETYFANLRQSTLAYVAKNSVY